MHQGEEILLMDTDSYHYADYGDDEMGPEESTSVKTTTVLTTTETSTTSHSVVGETEDDEFLNITMAAIGGLVALIVTIVIIAFIIKSMRRKRHNLRVYRERQERPPTVSLEIIDRDDHITETINGVQNSLYSQGSILPITVFDSQVHRGQTSSQQTHTSEIAGANGAHTEDTVEMQDEREPHAASVQIETNASAYSDYENTNISERRLLSGNDKPKQISMPNLNHDMPKHNQKQAKTLSTYSDYETAFPIYDNKSKADFEKIDKGGENVKSGKFRLESEADMFSTDKEITREENEIITKEEKCADKEVSKLRHEKPEAKIKPKPVARRQDDLPDSALTVTKSDNEDDCHYYENSLAKQEQYDVNEVPFTKEEKDADTTVSKQRHEKPKTKIKPKPVARMHDDLSDRTSTVTKNDNEDDSHDYENSLEKQEHCNVNKVSFVEDADTTVSKPRHETPETKIKPKPVVRRHDDLPDSASNVMKNDNEDGCHDYENSLAKQEQCDVNKAHNIKEDILIDTKVSKLRQPKIKPRPTAKGPIEKEYYDYENASAKVKRTKFQQAKLLTSIPPACNPNTYVNVPNNTSNVSPSDLLHGQSKEFSKLPKKKSIYYTSDNSGRESSAYVNVPDTLSHGSTSTDSLHRQSSEYEDSESVLSLQKHHQFQSKVDDRIRKNKQIKYKKHDDLKRSEANVRQTGSKPKHGVLKSKLPVPKSKKEFGLENKQSEIKTASSQPKAKLSVLKCHYATTAVRGSPKADYENEDKVKELKSTLKRLGKRGFSTSSLETCRQEKTMTKLHETTVPKTCTVLDEDLYLKMDAGDNVDYELYLNMDATNDETYVKMVTPEDDEVYTPMENNYSYPKPQVSKTLHHHKNEGTDMARSYQTCPKPCGGVRRDAYVNFSEQPTNYANIFRSRSTDSVYSYVGRKRPF